ncbi:MAG: SurA N-terminal domain-containing protein [Bacillota bacterium]|nr:SurA N-terminal domain-containing protein [Bacillota bacterium]
MARRVIAVTAIIAILAFAGYWFLWRESDVAAVVNGQEIGRADLNLRVNEVAKQYESYGMEVTKETLSEIRESVLDQLVVEVLLMQAADAAGIAVDEADVEDQYQTLLASYENEEQFVTLLTEYGYTAKTFRVRLAEQMAIQLLIDQHIADNVDPDDLQISEAEIRGRYDSYVAEMEEPPAFEDVYDYLKEELLDEKIHELQIIETLVEDLRAAAEIKIP